MDSSTTTTTPSPAVAAFKSAAEDVLTKLETLGEDELKSIAPTLLSLAQGALQSVEKNMTGILGTIEKDALNALFGAIESAVLKATGA